MKNLSWLIGAVIGAAIAISTVYFLQPKYGFVHNKTIFAEFNGKKELEAKLNGLKERHKYILDSLQTELVELNKENANNEVFQKKRAFYMNLEQEFTKEQDEKSAEYTSQIWQRINEYIKAYGDENGYTFIYGAQGSGSIMYADETKNVTDEIVKFMNAKYEGR